MSNITKEHALNIARKLNAEIVKRKNKAHDMAYIYYRGKVIALFGIRRGSSKNLGHDHIPGQIYLSPHNTRLLGECPYQKRDWLNNMKDKCLI